MPGDGYPTAEMSKSKSSRSCLAFAAFSRSALIAASIKTGLKFFVDFFFRKFSLMPELPCHTCPADATARLRQSGNSMASQKGREMRNSFQFGLVIFATCIITLWNRCFYRSFFLSSCIASLRRCLDNSNSGFYHWAGRHQSIHSLFKVAIGFLRQSLH